MEARLERSQAEARAQRAQQRLDDFLEEQQAAQVLPVSLKSAFRSGAFPSSSSGAFLSSSLLLLLLLLPTRPLLLLVHSHAHQDVGQGDL